MYAYPQTARRQPSASWEEESHQNLALLASLSQSSSLQNYEKIRFLLFQSPSVCILYGSLD